MKIFNLLLLILFINFSYIKSSFSEWRLIVNGVDGNEHYIDIRTIQRNNNNVYFRRLLNYAKPNDGYLSEISHIEGDCDLYRKKDLKVLVYKDPMGKGQSEEIDLSQYTEWTKWKYLKPKSVTYVLLNIICQNT